jgi:elongation factor 1-beta
MAIAAIKVKIMPESPETDLDEIKKQIPSKLSEAKNINLEEQPIAFGLKAIIATFAWPEEKGTDTIENSLKEIIGVSSAEVIDYRRAIG